MSLRITRGVTSLSHLPKRVRVIALVFLGLMAVLTMLSESGTMAAIGVSASPLKRADIASADQATDDVAINQDAVSAKNEVAGEDNGKTAKIITCPRCRLNSLPLVKKFVYDHAKLFEPGLKVDFIIGEDPVLYLYENEKEVSKIPLEVRLCWRSPSRCNGRIRAASSMLVLTLSFVCLFVFFIWHRVLPQSYDWKQIIQKLVKFGIKPSELTDEVKEALQDV